MAVSKDSVVNVVINGVYCYSSNGEESRGETNDLQCHEEIDFSREFASEEVANPGFVTPKRRERSSMNTPDAPRKVVPHFDPNDDEASMDDEETVVEEEETVDEAVATEAEATEAEATEAVATEAEATEAEAEATEAVATETVATEAEATEAEVVATEVIATEVVATEVVATEAVATETVATETVATEAVATETVATEAEAIATETLPSELGREVWAFWNGGDKLYKGRISGVSEDGLRVDIDYDDGDKEKNVDRSFITYSNSSTVKADLDDIFNHDTENLSLSIIDTSAIEEEPQLQPALIFDLFAEPLIKDEPDVEDVVAKRKRKLIQGKEEDTRISKKSKLCGRVEKVNADGNCLFSSFADQLFGDVRLHYILRFMCYNYLEKHPELKNFETSSNISQGFKFGEMAGELEIVILSMIFDCQVDVYDSKKNLMLSHNSEATTNDVVSLVFSNARTHYDSYYVDRNAVAARRPIEDLDHVLPLLDMLHLPENLSQNEVKIEAHHWKKLNSKKGFYYGTVVDSVMATPEMLNHSDLTVIAATAAAEEESSPLYHMVEFECGEKVWVHHELLQERKTEERDNDRDVQFTRSNRRIKKVKIYNPYRGY